MASNYERFYFLASPTDQSDYFISDNTIHCAYQTVIVLCYH